jgi:hypothetical protein
MVVMGGTSHRAPPRHAECPDCLVFFMPRGARPTQSRLSRMGALPDSVAEMLRGADEEFKALHSEIDAFFERKPYEVVTYHNANFTKHSQCLRFVEELPALRWSRKFYIGVQQLRSAVDHIIYAIAVKENGGVEPPPNADKLAFPIMTNPPDVPMWKVATLSDEVKAAIQRAQPDPNNLDGSVLWQLEKFNAPDKHRILRVAVAQVGFGMGAVHGANGRTTFTWHFVPLKEEAPFYVVTTERPSPNVKMRTEFAPYVCIERVNGGGQPEDFIPLMGAIHQLRSGAHIIIGRVAAAAEF